MFGRSVGLGATVLLGACALACDNTLDIPLPVAAGSGGSAGAAPATAGSGGEPWVSPVAAEISQGWTWQECGRILPLGDEDVLGHVGGYPIRSLAISGDGSLLASNAFLTLGWRVAESFADSQPMWKVSGEGASNVALTADGRLGSVSGDVRIVFDAQTGEHLYWEGAGDIPPSADLCLGSEFNFSPDGRHVAGKHYTNVVDVLETETFTRIGQFATQGCAQGVAFDASGVKLETPDGFALVGDGMVRPIATFDYRLDQWNQYESLTLAPDGSFVSTRCTETFNCSSSGAAWVGARRVSISSEQHWYLLGGSLHHSPSGETRVVDDHAAVSLFAPNGDIIVGEVDGTLVRFCRVD